MRVIRQYLLGWACVQRFGLQVLLNSCLGDGSLDLTRLKSTKRVLSEE